MRIKNTNGYEWVYAPDHPLSMSNGMIYKHRLVACELYGVDAVRDMHVHHIDGDVTNNDPDNLSLVGASKHMHEHRPPTYGVCPTCDSRFKKQDSTQQYCSQACVDRTVIDWPEEREVRRMVEEHGYTGAGRVLGVSDNAVRKHIGE